MVTNEQRRVAYAYAEAHSAAVNMVRSGEAKAYSVTYDSQRGRVIHVETDQGWNPDPFYEDYPLEQWERG